MEIAVVKALKPTSLRREFIFQQPRCEEILCFNANNVVVGEDFSVDDLLDFSNGEFQHGSVGKGIDNYEEEEDEEKDNTSGSSSSQSQDRTEDDSNSNYTGAGDSDFLFAGELTVPAYDMTDLEWVSHFVDDSLTLPELSPSYPVPSEQPRAWAEPEPRPGSAKPPSFPFGIPVKPRTTKTRKPNDRVWSFNPMLSRPSSPSSCSSVFSPTAPPLVFAGEPPAKKQKKKPEAQTSGPQFQRRCSHCQVQKTPQWRTGPMGAKTLCNACGVRYKSGRLFPEYRPACSPTFSGDIHSNSHRKVLEIRRRGKEVAGPEPGLDPARMVPSY